MSSAINKVKDALHLNKDHSSTTHTTGSHTGTTSTGIGHNGTTGTGVGHSGTGGGITGAQHGATSGTTGYGSSNTTAGPHSSNVANKADPRIDSDLDGSRNLGAGSTHTGTHGTTGTHTGATGTGYGSTHTGTHGTTGTHTGATGTGYGSSNTTAGPHSSNLANKADPRIDSDLDGSRTTGAGTTGYSGTHAGNSSGTHTGTTGGISHSSNAGPHNSNLANKADPLVDSDLDGRGNRHGASTGGIMGASGSHATAGSGTAQNTAGPHNSDLLNKVDPRVDSDRDGSKTYGGNATHQ